MSEEAKSILEKETELEVQRLFMRCKQIQTACEKHIQDNRNDGYHVDKEVLGFLDELRVIEGLSKTNVTSDLLPVLSNLIKDLIKDCEESLGPLVEEP